MKIFGFIFLTLFSKSTTYSLHQDYQTIKSGDKAESANSEALKARYQQPNSLSAKEIYKLRKMLRFSSMDDSLISHLLNGAVFPDLRKFHNLGIAQLATMMNEFPNKREDFHEKLAEYVKHKKTKEKGLKSDKVELGGRATAGYQGCLLDYGAFVEPITDTLYNTIRELCIDNNWSPLCYFHPELIPPPMPDWGLTMIDAMGKIPAGLSDGNINWVGAYDMCNDIHVTYNNSNTAVTERRVFSGMYCRLTLETQQPVFLNLTLPLSLGVCVPDTCSNTNVTSYIYDNLVLGVVLEIILEMEITEAYCGPTTDINTDRGMQAALGIVLALLVLVILSTLYDGFLRKRWLTKHIRLMHMAVFAKQSLHAVSSGRVTRTEFKSDIEQETKLGCADRLEMIFLSFSAYSHNVRIWRLTQKMDHIPVLNGIRVLTFGWVVLGNTWMITLSDSANTLRALRTYPTDWSFQAILNFHFASDTFFLLSGLLATYWWLKWFARRGRITCGMAAYYFLHKYWRLMPALMLTVAVYSYGFPYLSMGPLFPSSIIDAEYCKEGSWWKKLLMVDNLADNDKPCTVWMFYVSIAFQLHLVAIVVLVPLVLKPAVGYAMIAAMYISHIGATAGVTANLYDEDDLFKWLREYFLAPWCRAGPFVIGIMMGKVLAVFGWLVAMALILTPVYVTYDVMKVDGAEWDKSRSVAYDTLSRSSWALGLSWIIFACDTGYGGIISSFLGHELWIPLSRMTYPALLFQAAIIAATTYWGNRTVYLGVMEQIYRWFANLIASIILAWLIATLWQYPLSVGLEKAILCKDKLEWIKYGRHPEEEVAELEREYTKILSRNHDNMENGYQKTTIESSGRATRDYQNSVSSNDGLHKRVFAGSGREFTGSDKPYNQETTADACVPSSDVSTSL